MVTHIEVFAALLRELKERSGRSYGQLASRLHVSTSTLHRYCNGAAVPTEYAPVERLARLCGATPDELVTLHRRWLLADAERRTPDRTAEAVTTPVAGAAVEAAAEDAAKAEPQADPAAPAEIGDVRELPPTSMAPRPGRPRRAALVLGAVAAIAAVATLPLALRGGGGTQDVGASSPAPGRSAPGAVGTATPSLPVTSPSASPSGSSIATPSGTPSGTASSAASTTPGGVDADSAPPPVQVNVLADNWDTQCGQWFLMAQQPGKVPHPPQSLEQTGAWASALGGIPAGHLRLQLTAQGLTGQSVVLHALYVHVVSSKPAPKGIAYTPGSGCGGGLDPASFAVDLDATVPRTTPNAGYVGSGETATLSNFPYEVSTTDPQVLDVDASTVGQDVSWYLELVWSSGSRQGKLLVDDHGRPFRTVGLQGDPGYFYDGTAWSHTSPQDY
ncbi:helix-turn-helix domain-containing protein [Streptacidiphilus sp. EB129]|uniref:helix-turn-helix domain-containing protein n=1 Tax=Streptacidiphilus sp. EB129 TaxID=3156262 RepID=UPI00351371A9